MRRILICTGVLGGGTALTIAAAALAASMFPSGTMVYNATPMMTRAVAVPGGIAVPDGGAAPPDIVVPAPPEKVIDAPGEG